MKIYISLPITGYDLQERKKYAENVRSRLQQIYPDGEIITPFDVWADTSLPYEELIGKDIASLLTCDMVYVCNGSNNSKGCRLERYAALIYGIIIARKGDLGIKVEPWPNKQHTSENASTEHYS